MQTKQLDTRFGTFWLVYEVEPELRAAIHRENGFSMGSAISEGRIETVDDLSDLVLDAGLPVVEAKRIAALEWAWLVDGEHV